MRRSSPAGQFGSHTRLFSEVMPSAHVLGMMSWCTGLLYLNATVSEYKAMVAEGRADIAPRNRMGPHPNLRYHSLSETVSHEVIHCIQASLCGYPHKLSYDLMERMAELGSGNSTELLAEPGKAFGDLLEPLSIEHEGVSAVAIMESSALHAQKRVVYPNLTHRGYRRYLDDHISPGSPYRSAYDFVDRHSHEDPALAFEIFPAIAMTALCAASPAIALVELVRHADLRGKTTSREWRAELNRVAKDRDLKMLGDAEVVSKAEFQRDHPIFSRSLWRLATWGVANPGQLQEIFLRPHLFPDEAFIAACSPIVLRPDPDAGIVVTDYGGERPPGDDSDTVALAVNLLRLDVLFSIVVRSAHIGAARELFEPLKAGSALLRRLA